MLSNDTNDTFQCTCHKGCSDWSGDIRMANQTSRCSNILLFCASLTLLLPDVESCADVGRGNSCSVTQTVCRVRPRCLSLISSPAAAAARARSLWLQKAVKKSSSAAAENFFRYAWNEVVQPKPFDFSWPSWIKKKKSLKPRVDCHLFNMKFYIFQLHMSFSIVHLA